MKKEFTLFIAALLFSSFTFADCSDAVNVKTDSFTKKTSIQTETCTTNPNPERKYETASHILSSSGKDTYSLLLMVSYDEKSSRRYKLVVDDKGNDYKNFPSEKLRSCMSYLCSFFASTILFLDRTQLETAAKEGLNIRFDATDATSDKNRIFNIPASQAKAFLDTYDNVFKSGQ